MAKFDLYLDGKIAQSNIDSPVVIKDLKPDTQYDDYGLAYAGKSAKTTLSFKTATQPVTGVSLDKTTLSLETGKIATLKATVAPIDATNKGLNWASDNEKVATVDSKGVVTAVAPGTANIKVGTKDGNKSAQTKVTVKDPAVAVTGVKLDKTELSVEEGATAQLKATIAPGNATNKKVAWKSGNPEMFTIDGNGKVTGVKAGSATAVATTDDGGKTAEAKVTVTAKPEPEPDPEEPAE